MKNYFTNKINLISFWALFLSTCLPAIAQDLNFKWAINMGGERISRGHSVAVDAKGNVFVTGYFSGEVDFDPGPGTAILNNPTFNAIFIAKYDANGKYLWAKKIPGEDHNIANGIALDAAGNVYITGYFQFTVDFDPGPGTALLSIVEGVRAFVAKYDTDGQYKWAKQFSGESAAEFGNDIVVDAAGDVFVVGQFASDVDFDPAGSGNIISPAGSYDIFLTKFDGNGKFLWVKTMGAGGSDQGLRIALDATGNVFITGIFNQTVDFDPGTATANRISAGVADVFVAKYTNNGNYLWAKSIGSTGAEQSYGIAVDAGNNVLVTGYFNLTANFDAGGTGIQATSSGGQDIFLAKYAADGKCLWAKGMGGTGVDQGWSVTADTFRNVYVTGVFNQAADFNPGPDKDMITPLGGYDIFFSKYDSSGNYKGTKHIGDSKNEYPQKMIMDRKNNLYLTGYFGGTLDFDIGPGTKNLTSSGNGDVFALKLGMSCQQFSQLKQEACDSFQFKGVTYKQSGTYIDTFITASECDSIVTLELVIKGNSKTTAINGSYCDSAVLNGIAYTTSGIYEQHHTTVKGCDSLVTFTLSIGKSRVDTIRQTGCSNLVFNDSLFTASGTYTLSYTNTSGCDSVQVLVVTLTGSPDAQLSQADNTLTASPADSYQWLDCGDHTLIAAATERHYTVTKSGSYAVVITINQCSDTSECKTVQLETGIPDLTLSQKIALYPNPVSGTVTISAAQHLQQATIRMFNGLGQLMTQKEGLSGTRFSLDMSGWASGIYFLEIRDAEAFWNGKLVKE